MNNDSREPRIARRRIIRRKLGYAVLFLLVFVVFGPYLVSRMVANQNRIRSFEFDVGQPRSASPALRVVSFNLAHGRGPTDDNWEEPGMDKWDRIQKIAKLLKTLDADVVVLNEVDFNSSWSGGQDQAAAIATEAEYPYLVEQRNLDFRVLHRRWNFGNAILSKSPIHSAPGSLLPFCVTKYRQHSLRCLKASSKSAKLKLEIRLFPFSPTLPLTPAS